MFGKAIKKLVGAVKQALEKRDTKAIKHILRRGFHADYIFPSLTKDHVPPSARNLFLRANATIPKTFSRPYLKGLNYKDALGNILLHLAAKISDYELIALLLEKGADVTSVDKKQRTALHIACKENSLEIIKLLTENSPAYILDLPDEFGQTPLDEACRYNRPEIVQYLLSQGSSVVINDAERCGPLLNAVSNVAEYATPIASLLLDAGANWVASNYEMGHLVIVAEACFSMSLNRLQFSEINHADWNSETALITAIKKSAWESLAAVNSTTSQDYSYRDLCMLLIDRGCDVNAADWYGQTALHVAVETKQETLVRKLLISESDIDRRDRFNFTPLQYACLNGSQRLADLLLISGAKLRVEDFRTIVETWGSSNQLNEKNVKLLIYIFCESKCLTLKNLCNIAIRKKLGNVEKYANLLGLPPLLVKRLQLKE